MRSKLRRRLYVSWPTHLGEHGDSLILPRVIKNITNYWAVCCRCRLSPMLCTYIFRWYLLWKTLNASYMKHGATLKGLDMDVSGFLTIDGWVAWFYYLISRETHDLMRTLHTYAVITFSRQCCYRVKLGKLTNIIMVPSIKCCQDLYYLNI